MSARRGWQQDVAEVLGDIPQQRILQLVCGATGSAQDVCRLLASTKQLRLATQQHCTGSVEVKPPAFACLQRARDFAAWLSHNASLASALDIKFAYSVDFAAQSPQLAEDDWKAAAAAVGVALETAAAANNGASHISSCRMVSISAEGASILRHLPGSMLTELELIISCSTANCDSLGDIAAAIAHLQQLRRLSLQYSFDGAQEWSCMDDLLQPLSAMTRLTLLNVGEISSDMPLQHLPPSLKELTYVLKADGGDASQLRLGHLTALTKLHILNTVMAGNFILPLSLLRLTVDDVTDVACLLPLTNLRTLSFNNIEHSHAAADNLSQLSALTSLQKVGMTYLGGSHIVDAAAAAWRHMPLEELSFYSCKLNAAIIGHLGALSQLRSLTLHKIFLHNAGWVSLAEALSQMTALQNLTLIEVSLLEFDALALGASKLSNLEQLDIRQQPVSLAAATYLARIPQLAVLGLVDCDLCDSALIEVLLSQQNLEVVDVSNNSGITNAVLPVLSRMEHLADCDLGETSVTEQGVHHYMSHIKHCTVTLG